MVPAAAAAATRKRERDHSSRVEVDNRPRKMAMTSILDLSMVSSDTLNLIFSFCLGDDIEAIMKAYNKISLVSKAMQRSILHFTRCTPLKFPGHLKPPAMAFACNYKLKLSEFSFYTLNWIDMRVCTHMLDSCDLSSLQQINIKVCLPTDFKERLHGFCKYDARSVGVSIAKLDNTDLLTEEEFQQEVAQYLKKARNLEKLKVIYRRGELHVPLLSNLSNSLQTLNLCEGINEWVPPEEQVKTNDEIMQVIKTMPNLKRFKVGCLGRVGTISSNSIDQLLFEYQTFPQVLECPMLRILKIMFQLDPLDLSVLQNKYTLLNLEQLRITLLPNKDTRNSFSSAPLDEITDAIQKLPKLEQLVICTEVFPRKLKIRSETLKFIDLSHSPGLVLTECICPLLERIKMRCEYDPSIGFGAIPTIQPLTPFTIDDFARGRSVDDALVVEFVAGSQQFIGMRVPDSCIIEVEMIPPKLDWSHA